MDKVRAVLYALHYHQKEHNITKQCITNVTTFIDVITPLIKNKVTAKAVVGVGWDAEKKEIYIICGHLVVEIDDLGIFDPSHEIHNLKNTKWCDSFQSLNEAYPTREEKKTHLKEHLMFIKTADRINNGEFIIESREHYDKQMDFIQKMLPIHLSLLPLQDALLKMDKEKALDILEKVKS